jgi:hypothetical protein
MDFDLEVWLAELVSRLKETFGGRLMFAGLAGSYARGEATPKSDIDIHIVLDALELADLGAYRNIVQGMAHREKACGFICGKSDIAAWPVGEIFQFSRCRTLAGSLDGLVRLPDEAEMRAHMATMASALYHEAAHHYVFGPRGDADSLKGAYKAAFFVLQEWVFVDRGQYVPKRKDLLAHLSGNNKAVLDTLIRWDALAEDRAQNPDVYFDRIIRFARAMMANERGS